MQDSSYHMYPCGDHALTISFGEEVNNAVNEKVIRCFQYLQKNKISGVLDIIPAYSTVTIVYDLIFLQKRKLSTSVYQMICDEVMGLLTKIPATLSTEKKLIKIPVCYDLSLAPDLASLAAEHQLTTDEVIQIHTGKTYRVFMIGFLPGFSYMGSVDERINTPRLAKPRTLVPAGSVGIAGEQTGIYPFASPGGWQLIGTTPIQLFSVSDTSPCYLQPGYEVQFYPITLSEFENYKNA